MIRVITQYQHWRADTTTCAYCSLCREEWMRC
jgi:hypothetical protein